MRTAALILAAGASRRFGSPKQLARIGGRTMLEHVAATARDAGLDPIIVVVPPGLAVPVDTVPIVNGHPDAGISRSLQLGIAAVEPGVDAAVILLGDEPMLTTDAIRSVLDAARGGVDIVASGVGERVGPPVLLRRGAFGVASQAEGDEGLGPLLRSLPGVRIVAIDEEPFDVDTPADLARLDLPDR